MRSEGRVALVTGASRGIGLAILKKLARVGYVVIGVGAHETSAERISAVLHEMGAQGEGLAMDVADSEAVERTLRIIEERYGAPTVLVNNAGITRDNLLLRMSQEEWDQVLATNLTAIFRLSRHCVRGMIKARWGRIINVTSVVAYAGNPGQVNYAAAKAGVVGFSKSLALEVASRNITVNCVAPGFIETDMTQKLSEEQRKKLLADIPMGRIGTVDEVAGAVEFLASDAAAYLTGSTLHLNGGMYMI